jgi:hypothetical protein
MILAPGVSFDEARHEYWYKGTQLSGVTGLITRRLGLKMPQEFLEERREEGTHVHKAVQNWINTGKSGSIHPMVSWIISMFPPIPAPLFAEVLVSDFERYASPVDIVMERDDGRLNIYDIKTGNFKRDYCTWQMSIYKYLIEKHCGRSVEQCLVLAAKDGEEYTIFPKPFEPVEKLLYGR